MVCVNCSHPDAVKCGHNKCGTQRWKCKSCRKVFCEPRNRLLGTNRLPADKIERILAMLLEGNFVRSVERLEGIHRDTICRLILEVGESCERYFFNRMRGLNVAVAEVDELWTFTGCREKTAIRMGTDESYGDCWCFTAICPTTKLFLSYHVGRRGEDDAHQFTHKLSQAIFGDTQVNTDGLTAYLTSLPDAFGNRLSHGVLIKVYGKGQDANTYPPARVVGVKKTSRSGRPDMAKVSTSMIERSNLTLRTNLRRYSRLSLGHSKTRAHHRAMLAIFFVWYNFVRPHSSLKNQSPAMSAGLEDHRWSIRELLENISTTS